MGFPGALDVTCTYRLKIPGTLSVELTATTDEPTLCNLAHHSYFNLEDGGSGDILDHRLMLDAAAYLPVDDGADPDRRRAAGRGQRRSTSGRRGRSAHEANGGQTLYDHNFCLAAQRGGLKQAAWAQGADSGVEMEMWTTEPGVQFYAGHKVAREQEGLGGRRYKACMPASVWSRRSGRIRPTIPISRKPCCGPARSTGRRRSTGSGWGRRARGPGGGKADADWPGQNATFDDPNRTSQMHE